MVEYRTILTLKTEVAGKKCRSTVYGLETRDQNQAVAFGKALVEAGTAAAWRVISRSRPDYGEILDDLNGKWHYSAHVHYLSEADTRLPVFRGDYKALDAEQPAPVLLCDLCGLSVLTDDRDIVSGLPRHPECIPI